MKVNPDGTLTIMSDDPEAIAEMERLLGTFKPPVTAGPKLPVIYLKHAEADTVAKLLEHIFSGDSVTATLPASPAVAATVTEGRGQAARRRPARMATGRSRLPPTTGSTPCMVQANTPI